MLQTEMINEGWKGAEGPGTWLTAYVPVTVLLDFSFLSNNWENLGCLDILVDKVPALYVANSDSTHSTQAAAGTWPGVIHAFGHALCFSTTPTSP